MAVFLENICKFDDCGKVFQELSDLIVHIEECHINYDLKLPLVNGVVQTECLPLSYILKFSDVSNVAVTKDVIIRDVKPRTLQHSNMPVIINPVIVVDDGKEQNNDIIYESENDTSLPSYGMTPDNIYHAGRMNTNRDLKANNDRPFACPIPGCQKRYKNVNGIKYHSKNGHKNLCRFKRDFMCACGKTYKTSHGLKSHTLVHKMRYQEAFSNSMQFARGYSDLVKDNRNNEIIPDSSNMELVQRDPHVQEKVDCNFNEISHNAATTYYNVINDMPYVNTEVGYNAYYEIHGGPVYVPRRIN